MSDRTTQHRPPRYKLALVTWAGAYGVITLILDLLGPTMAGWPLMLTWIVLPTLTRLLRAWLLG
jgi:uncharacterized protein